jgi:glycosyltransferase involved in cell wall biosynthesis
MIAHHLLIEGAPFFAAKSFEIDSQQLAQATELERWTLRARRLESAAGHIATRGWVERVNRSGSILHLYGNAGRAIELLRAISVPWIVTGTPPRKRRWRAPRPPAADLLSDGAIHEAVTADFFTSLPKAPAEPKVFGTLRAGRDLDRIIDLTAVRLARIRDDLDWRFFDAPPRAEEMARLGAWVDPAQGERDVDGMTAEALVAGVPVVATRNAANTRRLARGARGFLVPNEPNELAHAILTALFKPEIAGERVSAGLAARDEFRPEHRADDLVELYRKVLG